MSGLGLSRTTGRAAQVWDLRSTRELTEADIVRAETEEKGVKPNALARLTERHKALARDLISGLSMTAACIKNGIHPSRGSVLKDDPTFQAFLTELSSNVDEFYLDAQKEMAGLGLEALQILRERIETAPEEFSIGQLVKITESTMDRTGHGPKTTTNVNVNIGLADRLESARRRALEAPRVIDLTAEAAE